MRLSAVHLAVVIAILSISISAQSADINSSPQEARIYLLGEIHDNPQSLTLRLAFINTLIEQGQQPILLMEQFDRENQLSLDRSLGMCADTDCVVQKVGSPGWDWALYKPFIQLALEKKVYLVAANLSNNDVRKVVNNGFSTIYDAQFIERYRLDQLSPELIKAQRISIIDGHCGMLPDKLIDPMVRGQIARDIWMVNAIQSNQAIQSKPLILIAGNGHIRKDAGVYHWLTPNEQSVTKVYGYIESIQSTDNEWYDEVYLMKSVPREDPCLVFKNMKSK